MEAYSMIDVSLVVNVMLGACAGLVLFNILKIPVWILTGTGSSSSLILGELAELRRALQKLDAIEVKLERIREEVMDFRHTYNLR